MKINEIFHSIQVEGINTGFPTIFVRFSGSNLRCYYLDNENSYYEGTEMTIAEIVDKVESFNCMRVCLTGGEPLLQKNIQELLDQLMNKKLMIETSGSVDLEDFVLPINHTINMDIKAHTYENSNQILLENFSYLRKQDEIKFDVGSRVEYEWAKSIMENHYRAGVITISPIIGKIEPEKLVKWILEDGLDVRFQIV